LAVLSLVGAVAAWRCWRARLDVAPPAPPHAFKWNWVLLLGLGVAGLFVALDFAASSTANPYGDWDATSIWNLRARYLAGGPELWRCAISPEIGGHLFGASHPGYPLFLSSFIGMLWAVSGGFTSHVPALVSAVMAASVLALLVGALAERRSLALGLLAGLLLAGTELFASQASAQYADLPLALAFLAALVLLDAAATPGVLLAAGAALGLAPWIKNEGLVFAVAALAVAAWRFRLRDWLWIALGALPGLLAVAALKTMVPGNEGMFPATAGEAFAKLANPARWAQVAGGFGGALLELGHWWAHPLLLLAVLAWALRLAPRRSLWLGIPILVALTAEFGLFLVSTADLKWHLGTSVSRLVLQLWPSVIWLAFSMLRSPEEHFPAPVVAAAPKLRRR
jgi:hypothetical protein